MSAKPLAPALTLWAAAYSGCVSFLLLGLLPQAQVTAELIAQLCWLALIGSVPTTLVLAAASRTAHASPALIAASTLAVAAFVTALGWDHTDFLLSGPRWSLHPRRQLARIGMVLVFAIHGAGGWLWLILGTRIERRGRLLAWVLFSGAAVALMSQAMVQYRAYEYSMAQLVFPSGVLCGAALYRLVRGSRGRTLLLGVAAGCSLLGAGSRFNAGFVATGEREVMVHSRSGALASLYVLPHFDGEATWIAQGGQCSTPRPAIEDAPIGIAFDARRSVIVISVDALRKDVIGTDVSGRPVTPALSRLAKSALSFENATSTYPATLFAVGSAFTGSSPAELYLAAALPETIFTRARTHVDRQFAVLPDVGWFRLPIVDQFLTSGVPSDFARSDARATDLMIERLSDAREHGASVMAWIHYYSPHDPYLPRRSFELGAGKKNAYLSEVAYFDSALGRLMQYLEQDGWLQESLVVFFSDHGEALGEKSYFGHHVYLDGWMIDVPLMLWHADLPSSQRSVGVSVADIAPTVLHFLGLPAPTDVAARSLFSLNPEAVNRPTFSEAFPVRGRELFDRFRLPGLDDATIRARLRGIRVASKGYEPKGAITRGKHRMIHHRGAGARLVYERKPDGTDVLLHGAAAREVSALLQSELDRWEHEQLRRIQCRLRISAEVPE